MNHISYSLGLKVIETIFDKIGRTNKFCVEFGFGSLKLSNERADLLQVKPNTGYMRLEGGWSGVFFDPVTENSYWNGEGVYRSPFNFSKFASNSLQQL